MKRKKGQQGAENNLPVAVLEHLTGAGRGTVTWLGDTALEFSLDEGRRPLVQIFESVKPSKTAIAILRRLDGGFEIEAVPGQSIWINGRPVEQKQLVNHDMIEFGNTGPMSRFCTCASRQPIQRSFPGILSDSFAYFRSSRRRFIGRLAGASRLLLSRFALETTYVFRIGVIVALALLGIVAYQQAKLNAILGERVTSGAAMMEELSRKLAGNREEAITPADLEALRRDLGSRMETAAERLSQLEERSTASGRIIRKNYASVLMIQSSYGFSDTESGRMLRQVLGPDGKPGILPNGLLMLSLDGDGPIAERQFVGTAFAIDDGSVLVTNRHVGLPWERDAVAATLSDRGLDPKLLKLVAYVPGIAGAIPAGLLRASETSDLALLRLEAAPETLVGLELAEEAVLPGAEIIVMGYPTGLRSLLAQAGEEFLESLQQSGDVSFWRIAERLAEAGKIAPLASRGIVGSVSQEKLVYDAETTHGGSGGPVFNIEGKVIAVNTAILPEYGGSNLGIPAAKIRELLTVADGEG